MAILLRMAFWTICVIALDFIPDMKNLNFMTIQHEDLEIRLKFIATAYHALWHGVLNTGEMIMITPLMFHVAVYIEPDGDGGYEDRYCFSNQELALKAIKEYEKTGKMRLWQKWHSQNISVHENYAYGPGVKHIPENSLYEVSWNATELSQAYPYDPT